MNQQQVKGVSFGFLDYAKPIELMVAELNRSQTFNQRRIILINEKTKMDLFIHIGNTAKMNKAI